MEKLCFQVTVPKRELIPVHLKWEKLKRVRCQRHFSNFLESTGLLESSNCCYLKNIKREFIIAQLKNSLTFLVSHILNFRKGLRKPQEPLPSSWRFQCGSAGGRTEVRCVKSQWERPQSVMRCKWGLAHTAQPRLLSSKGKHKGSSSISRNHPAPRCFHGSQNIHFTDSTGYAVPKENCELFNIHRKDSESIWMGL